MERLNTPAEESNQHRLTKAIMAWACVKHPYAPTLMYTTGGNNESIEAYESFNIDSQKHCKNNQ